LSRRGFLRLAGLAVVLAWVVLGLDRGSWLTGTGWLVALAEGLLLVLGS